MKKLVTEGNRLSMKQISELASSLLCSVLEDIFQRNLVYSTDLMFVPKL